MLLIREERKSEPTKKFDESFSPDFFEHPFVGLTRMEANYLSQPQKTRTTVDIYGQQYSIIGSESTSHIRLVASIVDDKMREISSKNSSLDINKLAVLTAVNIVHEHLKLKEDYEVLEKQLEQAKNEKD